MRRITMAALTLAAVLGGAVAASPAEAAGAKPYSRTRDAGVQPVHYDSPYHAPHRQHWHEQRRAHDQRRMAEAARREALRIERERAERRAWRHAQRHQYSQHRGW